MMKKPFEIRKNEFLPHQWGKRAKRYLLCCQRGHIEREAQQIASGLSIVREQTESEYREGLDRWEVKYDAQTGRPTPYWFIVTMPYEIFYEPRKRVQYMTDQDNYDTYVRTIAHMMDMGVRVFPDPNDLHVRWFGEWTVIIDE